MQTRTISLSPLEFLSTFDVGPGDQWHIQECEWQVWACSPWAYPAFKLLLQTRSVNSVNTAKDTTSRTSQAGTAGVAGDASITHHDGKVLAKGECKSAAICYRCFAKNCKNHD